MTIQEFIEILKHHGVDARCIAPPRRRFIISIADLRNLNNLIKTDSPRLAFIIAANYVLKNTPAVKQHFLNYGTLGENVTIAPDMRGSIGSGTIVESNTAIGATGQGFERDPQGRLWVMPQIGGVTIGTDCFIGSNVTICRGTLENTIIERRVRIAHGAQIGHNVHIGEKTFIANGVAIAGSVSIGSNCYIGSGAVIRNKVKIASNTTIGCGAVIVRDIKNPDQTFVGNPGRILEN